MSNFLESPSKEWICAGRKMTESVEAEKNEDKSRGFFILIGCGKYLLS